MEFIAAALAALAFKSQSLERLQFVLPLRRNGSRIVDAIGPPAAGQQAVGIPAVSDPEADSPDARLSAIIVTPQLRAQALDYLRNAGVVL